MREKGKTKIRIVIKVKDNLRVVRFNKSGSNFRGFVRVKVGSITLDSLKLTGLPSNERYNRFKLNECNL